MTIGTDTRHDEPDVARRLLSPAEAAQSMGISRATLYVLLRQGALQSVRVSRRARRITVASIDAYIEQRLADGQSGR